MKKKGKLSSEEPRSEMEKLIAFCWAELNRKLDGSFLYGNAKDKSNRGKAKKRNIRKRRVTKVVSKARSRKRAN